MEPELQRNKSYGTGARSQFWVLELGLQGTETQGLELLEPLELWEPVFCYSGSRTQNVGTSSLGLELKSENWFLVVLVLKPGCGNRLFELLVPVPEPKTGIWFLESLIP